MDYEKLWYELIDKLSDAAAKASVEQVGLLTAIKIMNDIDKKFESTRSSNKATNEYCSDTKIITHGFQSNRIKKSKEMAKVVRRRLS